MYRVTSAPVVNGYTSLYICGFLLAESGSPKRIVKLAKSVFGWIPGGLGIAALCAAAMFTAFTGASGVTIIALGGLLFPILINEKYQEKFSLGLLTTSGSLGLLFPPSLPIILYGLVSQTSVDKLFMAGLLPCLLLMGILGLYCFRKGISLKIPRTNFHLKSWQKLLNLERGNTITIYYSWRDIWRDLYCYRGCRCNGFLCVYDRSRRL